MNEQIERAQGETAPEEVLPEADPISLFFDALTSAIGVETVFGDPIQAGDRVIIPVAETSMGGGLGFGQGPADGRPRRRIFELVAGGAGGGGGGGGGASTRPVAVVIVGPEEVKVQPIVDAGKLAITSLASMAGLWKGITTFVKVLREER